MSGFDKEINRDGDTLADEVVETLYGINSHLGDIEETLISIRQVLEKIGGITH